MNISPPALPRQTRIQKHLSVLIIAITLLPMLLLVYAIQQQRVAAERFEDINRISLLRYQSLWLYGATERGQTGWQATLSSMQAQIDDAHVQYPEAMQEIDVAWPPFVESLQRTGHVDWSVADRMRQTANNLTNTITTRFRTAAARAEALLFLGIIGLALSLLASLVLLRQLRAAEQNLRSSEQQLRQLNAQLQTLASTDGLTNLKNRRACNERLEHEIQYAARYNTALSLVVIDVDHFKAYNDTFGHLPGDAVLQTVAQLLHHSARRTDMVARYGGEEFLLVLPETGVAEAMMVAERCRAAIAGYAWEQRAVTASFGVATRTSETETSQTLIARADEALYTAKARGRNCVVHADEATLAAPVIA